MEIPRPDDDGADPHWVYREFATATVGRAPSDINPTIGVGGFICDGCEEKHVIIAAAVSGEQIHFHTNTTGARELAAALIAAANRIDPQGGVH